MTTGPYRFVRHPIYTGLAAMLIGTALVYPRRRSKMLVPFLL